MQRKRRAQREIIIILFFEQWGRGGGGEENTSVLSSIANVCEGSYLNQPAVRERNQLLTQRGVT
jgi:hypothetical protein